MCAHGLMMVSGPFSEVSSLLATWRHRVSGVVFAVMAGSQAPHLCPQFPITVNVGIIDISPHLLSSRELHSGLRGLQGSLQRHHAGPVVLSLYHHASPGGLI